MLTVSLEIGRYKSLGKAIRIEEGRRKQRKKEKPTELTMGQSRPTGWHYKSQSAAASYRASQAKPRPAPERWVRTNAYQLDIMQPRRWRDRGDRFMGGVKKWPGPSNRVIKCRYFKQLDSTPMPVNYIPTRFSSFSLQPARRKIRQIVRRLFSCQCITASYHSSANEQIFGRSILNFCDLGAKLEGKCLVSLTLWHFSRVVRTKYFITKQFTKRIAQHVLLVGR